MNTSNSSRHLNGDSIASHNAKMKQTVANDLSPPERDFISLTPAPSARDNGCTYRKQVILEFFEALIKIQCSLPGLFLACRLDNY
jgi:hypothetical protein